MKTKVIFLISIILIIFAGGNASAQKTKVVKKKKVTRNWVWVPVSTITDMSLDGMIFDTAKSHLFYKELLTLKKKRGISYNPKPHFESPGYFILDFNFSPPRGIGARTAGEIKLLPASNRLFVGLCANAFITQFNVHTGKEALTKKIKDKSRFSIELSPTIGITKVQVVPLYVKFSPDPVGDSTEKNPYSSSSGWRMERFGTGLSIQLPEILPMVFDRGYLSILYGKTFYSPNGKEYYNGNTSFVGIVSHMAKDFNWCSVEGTFSGGIDLPKNEVSKIYYDANIRAMVNLLYHGNGWYSQVGVGIDVNNAQKNAFIITFRLIGPGKNKD